MNRISVAEMVRKANEVVDIVDAARALKSQQNGDAVLVDIRDIRELQREGKVRDASHVPRGMAEFWFDEESPYHKTWLADATKQYLLYCASGWRSALTAKSLVDMGFDNIAHVDGGFGALKKAGAEIIRLDKAD